MGFDLRHKGKLVGILFLSSPMPNLSCRDRFLDLPKDPSERGRALRHYMDLSVCVGVQPLSWYWNLGKLIALLATTVGGEFEQKYGDTLYGITTTGIYGAASQYNRIYKRIGNTKGFGTEHLSDKEYYAGLSPEVLARLPRTITNARMKRTKAMVGSDFHGKIRSVYYSPVSSKGRDCLVLNWFERWGSPRYEKTCHREPPYHFGRSSLYAESR
jgi:hypothetical protein